MTSSPPTPRSEHEYVWGIDPAISHLAFAFADLNSDTVTVETLITRNTETEGARLGLLDRQLRIYANQAAGRYPSACVWVEQPAGKWVSPQLYYAVGVIQAALHEALAVPVWSIAPSAWKKRALGYGNATKQQVAAWVSAQHHHFDDQDEADAVCIAAAGRSMFTQRSWDTAA